MYKDSSAASKQYFSGVPAEPSKAPFLPPLPPLAVLHWTSLVAGGEV